MMPTIHIQVDDPPWLRYAVALAVVGWAWALWVTASLVYLRRRLASMPERGCPMRPTPTTGPSRWGSAGGIQGGPSDGRPIVPPQGGSGTAPLPPRGGSVMTAPTDHVFRTEESMSTPTTPSLTTDPNDPNLRQSLPDGQQKAYLVLSPEERAKGFVRPVRRTYRHRTCGKATTMSTDLAETYARQPDFYNATFCVHCGRHCRLVNDVGEPQFFWTADGEPVGS